MRLVTTCHLDFDLATPTPFILMLRPRSGAGQWIAREEYELTPAVQASEFLDDFGNLCQRLMAPVGRFSIHTSADVVTSDRMDMAPGAPFVPILELPIDTLKYLLPSRYCEVDGFSQMANEITEGQTPGYDQVVAINDWVRKHVRYIPGSSDLPLSATEINERRSGVCRDLAHLAIAMARALTIPARLVVGYLHQLQPMDLHAWFEAFVDGRWYTFDPTQSSLRAGYVLLGYGRDAADVAVYTRFGPPVEAVTARVSVEEKR